MSAAPRSGLLLLLLAATVAAPAQSGKVELELVEGRHFAPNQPIGLRLRNGSARPLFLIAERRSGLRTEQGRRFPGVPVHERRKRKFFFRSDRWVYTSTSQARFAGALLQPGDAIKFDTRATLPASYRIHLRYWWVETAEEEKELLRLDMKTLEEKYGQDAHWLSTPAFRIQAVPKTAPKAAAPPK